MNIATRPQTTVHEGFEEQYVFQLRAYATGGGESALVEAYELGRLAITEQKSLMEVTAVHHQALKRVMDDARDEKHREDLLRTSADFLAECLSPYEISHRGSRDAAKALRQINETLEEEIKRIAYAVHDEAGQLLVAVHFGARPNGSRVAQLPTRTDWPDRRIAGRSGKTVASVFPRTSTNDLG